MAYASPINLARTFAMAQPLQRRVTMYDALESRTFLSASHPALPDLSKLLTNPTLQADYQQLRDDTHHPRVAPRPARKALAADRKAINTELASLRESNDQVDE